MTTKRMVPKVSGLVKSGVLRDIQNDEISNYLPSFDTSLQNPDQVTGQSMQSYDINATNFSDVHIILLPINSIQRSRFQNRAIIDETYINDLAENIKADGLNQPITVRPIGDKQYEVIAGEHRYEAYKLLKRNEIPAIIRKLDDRQAARSLCYDNLFHKKLSDFEIFRGFQKLMELDKSLSLRGIAKDTGLSFSHVQRIMTFGKLPAPCIEILNTTPGIIGANVSENLAKHTAIGQEHYVIEALKLIRDGKLTQMRASAWIESKANLRQEKISRMLIDKSGKPYCTLTRNKYRLNIKVSNEIDVATLEEAIYEILRKQAESKTE